MRVETFDLGERLDRRTRLGEIFPGIGDETVPPAEVVGRKAVEHVRRAARGQHVRRTGDEIACALRRPGAGENRTGAAHALHHLERILGHDLEVLGREAVDDFHSFLEIFRHDYQDSVAVHDALDYSAARKRFRLGENFLAHFLGELARRADAKRLLQSAAVLGLAQKIGRHPARTDAAVGENRDFAWARDLVDGDIAVDLALGGGNERVAGTGDLLHLAAALGAVGHHADSLNAADAVDFSSAGKLERVEQNGIVK